MIVNNEFWYGRKVFITGGSGFIGSHLVTKLKSMGCIVRGYIHKTPARCDGVMGDISQKDSIEPLYKYLKSFSPDIVFHLAAQPLVNYAEELLVETLDVNISGGRNLLLACKDVPSIKSIIYISTDKVYGNIPNINRDAVPYGIEHPYNFSKLSGDLMAQLFVSMWDMPIGIVRNGNVYGDGDNHIERIVPRNMDLFYRGKNPTIRGNGSMSRDYIHVSEIVIGYINAAEFQYNNKGLHVFIMGSKKSYSVLEVIKSIWEVCAGRSVDFESMPVDYEPVLNGEIPHQHIEDKWTEDAIGWNPRIDLIEGLKLAYLYYKGLYEN